MSEEIKDGQTEGQAKAVEGTEQPETDYKALYEETKAKLDDARAKSRKWESRSKANKEAADSAEKMAADIADLKARLDERDRENAELKAREERSGIVDEVARKTGVPREIVATLNGMDSEERHRVMSEVDSAKSKSTSDAVIKAMFGGGTASETEEEPTDGGDTEE